MSVVFGSENRSVLIPWRAGDTPVSSEVIAAVVMLGATVLPRSVDAPRLRRRLVWERPNRSMASGRSPSSTTMITRRMSDPIGIPAPWES